MTSRISRKRALHANLFTRQPFERHVFVVQAPAAPLWVTGDYTTSDRPVSAFVPAIVEDYQRWGAPNDVTTLLHQAPPGTRFVFNSAAMETVEQAKAWLHAARAACHQQMKGGVSDQTCQPRGGADAV